MDIDLSFFQGKYTNPNFSPQILHVLDIQNLMLHPDTIDQFVPHLVTLHLSTLRQTESSHPLHFQCFHLQ